MSLGSMPMFSRLNTANAECGDIGVRLPWSCSLDAALRDAFGIKSNSILSILFLSTNPRSNRNVNAAPLRARCNIAVSRRQTKNVSVMQISRAFYRWTEGGVPRSDDLCPRPRFSRASGTRDKSIWRFRNVTHRSRVFRTVSELWRSSL
jgi:hypothetical protein